MKKNKNKTFSFVSLGCPKNLVDSESMFGILLSRGFELVSEDLPADLVLINTCGFIADARQEAETEIARVIQRKERGEVSRIVVCGCLIPTEGEKLLERFPGVDAWVGPFDEPRIAEIVGTLPTVHRTASSPANRGLPVVQAAFHHHRRRTLSFFDQVRLTLTQPHVAYLKIAEGCDRFCSYCAIPNIRGRFVSKPIEAIEEELDTLADSGVREVVLIAQETTFWGSDLEGGYHLAELLRRLREKNAVDWIRVLYAYPTGWNDDLIAQFAVPHTPGQTWVLPYIDLPLQHASDRILKRMNRRTGSSETQELLIRLRESIPNLVLRSTFIVGFPGETEEEFLDLLAFVRRQRFERCGVFAYSAEKDTPAAAFEDQVNPKIKQTRYEELYKVTTEISRQYAASRVGNNVDILVDAPAIDETGEAAEKMRLGRSWAEAPDIDPVIYVTTDAAPGEMVQAEIVLPSDLDVIAADVDLSSDGQDPSSDDYDVPLDDQNDTE